MRTRSSADESTPPRTPVQRPANADDTESLQEGLKQCFLTPSRTSSPILTPPSSVGPSDRVNPFDTDEDIPSEPCYDPAFQSALSSAADIARKIAQVLDECPQPEDTIRALRQDATNLSSYRSPPTRLVGVIGHSGQGKSSLINSLLDVEDLAVTGEDGSAVTAFVIEYRHRKESQPSKFLIEARCLTIEEIDEQLEAFLRNYQQPYITPCNELTAEDYKKVEQHSENAERIFETAFSGYDDFDVVSLRQQDFESALSILQAHARKLRWPQGMANGEWSCHAETPQECHASLKPFMESGTWPFITSMSVQLDSKVLRSGIILADLPGYHDVNYARTRNAKRYQVQCKELFVVADIKRAADDPVIKEAIRDYTSAAAGVGEGSFPSVTVVCTHSAVFSKKPKTLKDPLNETKIQQAKAHIESLERKNLGTGLQTRHILEEANLALTSIYVQERNETVKQALQKAYAKDCGPSGLQVYCVDNLLYQNHDSLLAHAISGIPFLRQHTLSLPAKALFRFGNLFLGTHVPQLVQSLQIWLEAITSDQSCTLSGDLDLAQWFSLFDTDVEKLKDAFTSAYKQKIKEPLHNHQQAVTSNALDVCDSWRSWHQSSFRAFLNQRGTHYTPAVGYRCWNTELVECLNFVTAVRWTEIDQTISHKFASLTLLVYQEFAYMTEELKKANAPASLLQSLTHRENQVQDVLERTFEEFENNLRIIKQRATTGGFDSYILEYMNPVYDRCQRDSGKSKFSLPIRPPSPSVPNPTKIYPFLRLTTPPHHRHRRNGSQPRPLPVTHLFSGLHQHANFLAPPSPDTLHLRSH